jgi:hypothetical protein
MKTKMLDFRKTYLLPFKYEIPNFTQDFLEKNNLIKRYLKFFKRFIFIFLSGQSSLEVNDIGSDQKKILWINVSAPSIGDSLMDLSSRILLKDRKIDLYTEQNNAEIYRDDLFFSNIYTNKSAILQSDYDLVILDSYSTRSFKVKVSVTPQLKYVGMFGYFNGPEVNRVLFSFHRMNQLLGYKSKLNQISKIARPRLSISVLDKKHIEDRKLPNKYIAISVGGEWAYRTYNNWDKVIENLFNSNREANIVLVGSDNGIETAKQLTDKFSNYNLISYVSKCSFNQTAEIINRADLLLCCDGGLMHAANAMQTPIIPLFARLSEKMQLTDSICAFGLFNKYDVNNIDTREVCKMYKKWQKSI